MNSPFPRTPDDLPDAWPGTDGRFTPSYEARAETLWKAAEQLGLSPDIDWAGGQDGEAFLAHDGPDGELVWVTHLEDPNDQEEVDKHIAKGDLAQWMRDRIAAEAAAAKRRNR